MRKFLLIFLALAAFAAFVKYVGLSHARQCTELQQGVEAVLAQARSCSSDADCTVQGLSCPFPCTVALNRQQVHEVLARAGEYHRSCMMVCPDCPKSVPEVRCMSGQCALLGSALPAGR